MARVERESGRAGRSGTAAEDVVAGAVVVVVEVGIAGEEVVDAARSQGLGGEAIPKQAGRGSVSCPYTSLLTIRRRLEKGLLPLPIARRRFKTLLDVVFLCAQVML